jgi:hypothetical protein
MEHNLFKEWKKVESKLGSHPHDHNVYMHSKNIYEKLVGTKLDHNILIQKDLNDNPVATMWMITLGKIFF